MGSSRTYILSECGGLPEGHHKNHHLQCWCRSFQCTLGSHRSTCCRFGHWCNSLQKGCFGSCRSSIGFHWQSHTKKNCKQLSLSLQLLIVSCSFPVNSALVSIELAQVAWSCCRPENATQSRLCSTQLPWIWRNHQMLHGRSLKPCECAWRKSF